VTAAAPAWAGPLSSRAHQVLAYLDQREPSSGRLKVEADGGKLKYLLDLRSGDPCKPFDELIKWCSVLEVVEECPR
jgi:hypothetical protein